MLIILLMYRWWRLQFTQSWWVARISQLMLRTELRECWGHVAVTVLVRLFVSVDCHLSDALIDYSLVGINYRYQNQNTIYNTGVRHNIWLTVFSEKKLYKKGLFFSNFWNTIVEALWWSQNWIECLDVQAQHLSSILYGLPCQFDSLITCLYWYYDMWLQVLTVTVLVYLLLDRI